MGKKMVDVRTVSVLTKKKGPEARAAEDVATIALAGRFLNAPGLGWLEWDGRRWADSPVVECRVHDEVRSFADAAQRKWENEAAALYTSARKAVVAALMEAGAAEDKAHEETAGRELLLAVLGSGRVAADVKAAAELALEQSTEAYVQAGIWLNLLSAAAISAMTRLASRMKGVLVDHRSLDAHPDLLNVENGVVDLRTGELSDHDPGLLITKLARGEYRKGARCPRWSAALKAVHPEIRDWMQVRMGQSATGYRPDDDVLFVCWGSGANGKSTVMNAVRNALGDYAGLVPHRALMASADAHPTELTTFRGLRLALMEETPEEGHLDMHRVKTTVGTPTITARKIRQDDIEFPTTHTMWINTNHKPQVSGADHGTWRRLLAVPWPYTFVGPGGVKKTDEHLDGDRRLRPDVVDEPKPETSAAILAWLVAGAAEWYANDRVSPAHPTAVLDASERWRTESDVALLFIQDNLVGDEQYFIPGDTMREAVMAFLAEQGKNRWSAQTINARLIEAMAQAGISLGATPEKASKVRKEDVESWPQGQLPKKVGPGKVSRRWLGVRFRTPADDAKDQLRSAPGGA